MSEAPVLFEPPKGQEPVRGHVRAVGHERVTHGFFLPEVHDEDPHGHWSRTLHTWLGVAEDAVFTHITAARLYGWELPKLPEQVPVFIAVGKDGRRPRRDGLVCSRLTRPRSKRVVGGFPVEEPEEVLLRLARDFGVLDLVTVLDSARHMDDVDEDRLQAVLDSRRPGVGVLRAARELSDAKRESAGESVLGVFEAAMQIEVETQVDLFDDDGVFLGRADTRVSGTCWIYEYDGAVHRNKGQHRTDLRRERAWSNTAYRRKGFTLDDLLNHAGVVMHELDRDLGRPHVNARLRRWQVLVRESLYSEVGRARILNRWQRAMGVIQWS
jgi:hypothetical protein